jgi:transcriptional regulator with XRE-family HTH domain
VSESRDVGDAIGYQLRRLRRLRGLTQEALADRANVSRDLVAKLEQGRRHTARITSLASLARALDVELSALVRSATPVPESASGRSDPQLLRDGSAMWKPATTMMAASTLVDRVHHAYQTARYIEAAGLLSSVTDTVDAVAAEGRANERREALRLQTGVAIAAAKLSTKAGDADAGQAAAERARHAAEAAEDTVGQAAAAYQLICALLRAGRREQAETHAVCFGEELRGGAPDTVTWRGALTLIGAIIAARRGDRAEAGRRLDHAAELARRLGTDGNIGWTWFGPTNVMIHRVSAAVALGDPLGALATTRQIDIAAMPAGLCGRQAQVHMDSAWAHAQLGEDALAVIHLLDAERVAADLMVVSPEARGLIRDLLLRERRGAMPGLRGLALRAGVAA